MLDERSRQVLFAVIQCYINSPGPVGSRVVTKKFPFGLSPATIRNIMSDLEDNGYLMQPHTSAGRIPTDTGYRCFVDAITSEKQYLKAGVDFSAVNKRLEMLRKDINLFLDDASKMISSMSHYIGITQTPNAGVTTLNRIELIKYRSNQVAVILFTDEGIMKNGIIEVDSGLSQDMLNRISDYINSHFSGTSLDEIRSVLIGDMIREKVLCDNLIHEAIRLCKEVFSSAQGNVYISGLSGMLSLPDFCDIGRIKDLMHAIEDKQIMVEMLDKVAESEGTRIFIGSENPMSGMKQFSVVASTYQEGNRPAGVIGIIGPTRMNYLEAISIVDMTAKYITEMLSYK